jgi:hypothetical protein
VCRLPDPARLPPVKVWKNWDCPRIPTITTALATIFSEFEGLSPILPHLL